MYSAFAIELSDLSKPFKFARLKGFERLENCLTKGTYERFWKVKQLSEQTYHSPIFLPFKSFQRVLKGVVVQYQKIMECFKRFRHIDSHFACKQILKGFERSNHRRVNGGFLSQSEHACGSTLNLKLIVFNELWWTQWLKIIPPRARAGLDNRACQIPLPWLLQK